MKESNEQIIEQIRQGGDQQQSMEKLYCQNRGYIRKAAAGIAGKYISEPERAKELQADLEQEAYFGLLEAVNQWSPDRGTLFLSYAGYWIRHFMIRYCEKTVCTIRLPTARQSQIREYERTGEAFQKSLGRRPTTEEYCSLLKVEPEALEEIRAAARIRRLQSLDQPLNPEDAEAGTVGDLVQAAGDPYGAALDRLQLKELRAVLWPAVDALPEDQAHVIRETFQKGKTLQQISKETGQASWKLAEEKRRAINTLERNRALQSFYDAERYSYGIRGGFFGWMYSGTSSTEFAAFKMIQKAKGK